jgi:glycosyltransferase involved in cell wall biosynthesis
MPPKVTVIMPCHNAAGYIDQAIRSILIQSFRDWELLIIDDHSTDGSWEQALKYASDRIKVFRNESNLGNSHTLNRGIALASGQYIARMDADDLSFPDRFGKQLDFLLHNPEVDAVGCGLFKVSRDLSSVLASSSYPVHHKEIVRLVPFRKLAFIFGPNIHIADGCVMARTAWFRTWRYDETIRIAQDFDLYYRARMNSVYANLTDYLYVWRRGGRTTPFSRQMQIVVQRFRTIIRSGFRINTVFESIFALLFLLPRPLFSALTFLYLKVSREMSDNSGNATLVANKARLNDLLEKLGTHEQV